MILADKIIRLRKKNGWSQEELAEKMKVSRQAVSKWESAQTVPDLEKILQLGEWFGVTTDYLLKDEIEEEEFTDGHVESGIKRITMPEAHAYLEERKAASIRIAAATFLCILSPIPLLLLGAASTLPASGISESLAASAGLGALIVLAAAAVGLYISCGFKNAPYTYMDEEPFETEYGVIGMVKERQRLYRDTYRKTILLGVSLCILSPLALFFAVYTEDTLVQTIMLTVTMFIAGIGTSFLIAGGVRSASFQRILKEGAFTAGEKKRNAVITAVSSIYWMLITAVYLGWSFVSNAWQTTWIIWPVAGVLFSAVKIVCNLLVDRDDRKR